MLRFRVHILKFIIFIALHAYLNAHAAVIGSQQVIQPAALVQATPTLPSSLSSSSSNMPGIPSSTQLPNLKDPQLAAALQNLPAEQKAQLAETAKQYLQQQPQTTEPVVSAEPKQAPVKNKRDAAFEMLLNQALPMSPDQIKEMRRLFDIVEEAKFTTPKTPPTPISSSTRINLEPGSLPPLIRLSAGFVTSVNFIDTTGAPWPIASYGIGDPQAFNIQWDQHSNTLFIQSLRVYSHGNMAIKLKDLDTPIMISLVSGQREVDFRVDFQVAGRGPQATAPILPQSMTTPAQVNPMLINFLDGIPPQGSTKLDAGRYGDAWIYQNKMYFRSKLKLLSPAWMATLSSPDGTHVYEMMKTPLILATENGVTVHIVLKGM
jgi:intracellular multiplication protein IcmK